MKYVCPSCKKPYGEGEEGKAPRLCPACAGALIAAKEKAEKEQAEKLERDRLEAEARAAEKKRLDSMWVEGAMVEAPKKPAYHPRTWAEETDKDGATVIIFKKKSENKNSKKRG